MSFLSFRAKAFRFLLYGIILVMVFANISFIFLLIPLLGGGAFGGEVEGWVYGGALALIHLRINPSLPSPRREF